MSKSTDRAYRPYRGGLFPKTLGQCVGRVTRPALGKQGAAEARLLTHWAEIAGAGVARYSVPEKIIFPRRKEEGATLVLGVQSGRGPEIQYQEPLLLERIAAFFGYRAVARITLRQRYLATPSALPEAPEPPALSRPPVPEAARLALESVADPELRAALASLAVSMATPRLPTRKN